MAKKSFGLKNFLFSFVIVCIVIYIFQNGNGSVDTMIAKQGVIEDIIYAQGIVVKDETVFNADANGSLTIYRSDGDKVKKGTLVADISADAGAVKNQIAEIEAAIKQKNNDNNLNSAEDKKNSQTDDKDEGADSNQENSEDSTKKNDESVDKYKDLSVSQLQDMKDNLNKSIGTNKIPYYSSYTGLVSYKTDGLEELYKYENVLELTPSATQRKEYKEADTAKNTNISKGDRIFKIVKNFDYYIAATVDNKQAKLFEENKYIKTRIISDDNKESEMWGYIKKINYGSENSVLIIYFDDYCYKVYDKRYLDIQLVNDTHEGIKINSSALIKKDGIAGVYVKDASNIIKFFPVQILGQDDKNAVIYIGDYVSDSQRRTISVSDKIYETIKIFDKVVINPDKVYEGEIVK